MFFYCSAHINKNYKIILIWKILKKIPILKLEITKEKLQKLYLKNKIKDINLAQLIHQDIDKDTLKKFKKFGPKIKHIDFYMDIGTEDARLTSYLTAIISSVLGIALKKQLSISNSNKFIINPVYANKNILNLKLDCIFKVKVLHIMYIAYILKKKRRDDKNVRTSNRRTYDYSYE